MCLGHDRQPLRQVLEVGDVGEDLLPGAVDGHGVFVSHDLAPLSDSLTVAAGYTIIHRSKCTNRPMSGTVAHGWMEGDAMSQDVAHHVTLLSDNAPAFVNWTWAD